MDNKTPARSNQANNANRSYTRQLIVGTVVVVSVSALIAGGRWLTYRMDHVVVSDAEVKGTITKIGARLDGQVKAILVNPGERVTKGQVLVKLEDQHLQAAAELAEAEFEAATNELSTETMAIKQERVRIPVEVEKATSILQSSSAVLEGDQSEAKRLSNEFQRVETLFKEGMASASDLDAITGARGKALADVKSVTSLQDAAQAGLEATKLELDALRIREAHLGALQARVAIARAKIAAAQADLEAAILRAPEDGWVVERIVELGGSAKVGEPMISLWIGHPWVEAWASEKALSRLQLGSKARISLDAFPGRALRAHVESFGLLTDKELLTRPMPTTLDTLVHKGALVRVCLTLEDEDTLRLQPGLSAVVGIKKSGSNPGDSKGQLAEQRLSIFASVPATHERPERNSTKRED